MKTVLVRVKDFKHIRHDDRLDKRIKCINRLLLSQETFQLVKDKLTTFRPVKLHIKLIIHQNLAQYRLQNI